MPLSRWLQSSVALSARTGALRHPGPYPKAHYKPPPPASEGRVVVEEPPRPLPKAGEAPAPGARRLVPVRAYVEGQGWIELYQLVDETDPIR